MRFSPERTSRSEPAISFASGMATKLIQIRLGSFGSRGYLTTGQHNRAAIAPTNADVNETSVGDRLGF